MFFQSSSALSLSQIIGIITFSVLFFSSNLLPTTLPEMFLTLLLARHLTLFFKEGGGEGGRDHAVFLLQFKNDWL